MVLNIKKPAPKAKETPAPAAKASVSTEKKDHGKVVAEVAEEINVENPNPGAAHNVPWCEVSFEASYTHNLGNYQSARVQVGLRIPCQHGEIEDTYDYAEKWVNSKIEKLVEDMPDAS